MMKIAILKKANLSCRESQYALFRDEREIGQLTDPGNNDEFGIVLGGRSYRVERTRSGIETGGFLSGFRNLVRPKGTGEFRLVDASGTMLATARQPRIYEFFVSAGTVTFSVPRIRGQALAKLQVLTEGGEVVGEIRRGAWKITGRSDWFTSLPENTDPIIEAFLLWLYVMSENQVEDSS